MKKCGPAVMTCIALGLFSCTAQPPVDAPQSFAVAEPTHADTAYERQYVGEVQAIRRAEVRSRIRGRIESVAVDEGQSVTEGQLLFSLEDKELQQELRRASAAVASATAELKSAQTERANTKILLDKRIVSPAEMALLDAKIQSLDAGLEEERASQEQAEINLGYTQVRAPFDGVVGRLPLKSGTLVDDGDLLTAVADASEVLVYFRMPEREYLEYAATNGDGRVREVSFILVNGERLTAPAIMGAAESEIDRSTGTIAFRARFANESSRLKHGSTGKIVVKSYFDDAISVPQKSTFEVQDQVYLYVVDADNTARLRRIIPKMRLNESFVVESGITVGERFIVEGMQKVRDGERVVVRADAPSAG